MITRVYALLAAMLSLPVAARAAAPAKASHKFQISGDRFLLDGRKLVIISGEMHYPRVPRAEWRDRMRKMRAMGLNTLTTYVFWNAHEATPGKFDFVGNLDVAEYVRTAQEEGLWVILRPGPYVCAEWDLGGLPSWLLRDPEVRLRENEPKFLAAAKTYMNEVGRRLAPLMVDHGGPILMVQVENEYGSFGADHEYMKAIRTMIREAGFDGQLYTADGSSAKQLAGGTLPGLPVAINFGNNEDPAKEFANLKKFGRKGPRMCGEFWAGWFDTWGEKHATTPVERAAAALDWMLSRGISVSLYMIHGGTSFGFDAGADFRKGYMPDTTSYDYDSPIDESGRPTPKFAALRDVIRKHLPPGTVLPDPPVSPPLIEIPAIEFRESAALELGAPVRSEKPLSMEELGQANGIVVYRHKAETAAEGTLEIDGLADYAIVSVDGQRVGTLDRRLLEQKPLPVALQAGSVLEVMVDTTGHINFGRRMQTDRKGMAAAKLAGVPIEGWAMYGVPFRDLPAVYAGAVGEQRGPAFYRTRFDVASTGDTYLDLSGWGKGIVWVNGHSLGRYWSAAGPQQALFLPGAWLKERGNEVVVFDIEGTSHLRTIRGVTRPIWRTPELPAQ